MGQGATKNIHVTFLYYIYILVSTNDFHFFHIDGCHYYSYVIIIIVILFSLYLALRQAKQKAICFVKTCVCLYNI